MAQAVKGKNSKEINVKYISPNKNIKIDKSVVRESIGSNMDESAIVTQNAYEEMVAIAEDVKRHMERLVNIKTSFKEHLVTSLAKMTGIVKKEMERRKYAEGQMADDKISYTQDILMVQKEHIQKLERLLERNEVKVNSEEIVKGIGIKMETMKEQLKKEIIQEIKMQGMKQQEEGSKGKIDIQGLVPEIRKELEKIIEPPPLVTSSRNLTFAEVANMPKTAREIVPAAPRHTVIISSNIPEDTGEDVVVKLKDTLDARNDGLQIEQLRKVRNQKVLVSTSRKEDLEKIKSKVQKSKNLTLQEANNRNPLVLLRNVFKYISEEALLEAIIKQNKEMVEGLGAEETAQTKIKYRRTARNSLQDNVVLEVHPKLWAKLVASRRLYVDIQRVAVEDRSPLIQCTKCLGYGHGRRMCSDQKDCCSHCGQEHLKMKCPELAEGKAAVCINCKRAGLKDLKHDAISGDCPTRAKWDAIARSKIQYYC